MAHHLIQYREKNAPKIGEKAPKVALLNAAGEKVRLADCWAEKPAVVIFGSLTCDQTYDHAADLNALHQVYGSEFNFTFIYIRDAHPSDGWDCDPPPGFPRALDAKTNEVKRNICRRAVKLHEFPFPALTDPVTDPVAIAYAAWPSRLYVIDTDGVIRYQSPAGPWGYRPTELAPGLALNESEKASGFQEQATYPSLEAFLKTWK